jgi:hypothetical protein
MNGAVELRLREEIESMLAEVKADFEPDQGEWGLGFDAGFNAALEWVLKSEPWTVAP